MRGLFLVCLLCLTGCESLLNTNKKNVQTAEKGSSCVNPQSPILSSSPCDLIPWFDYWLVVSQLPWSERQKLMVELGDSEQEQVKRILLSYVVKTPYQTRLRAQILARAFVSTHTSELATFVSALVLQPNQEALEWESAAVTFKRISEEQKKALINQEEQLLEQKQKIEKLMQIEVNIIEKPSEKTL